MKQPLVVFSHGKESGPLGAKIQALMAVARQQGAQVLSVDYRQDPPGVAHDPAQAGEDRRRVAQLLATPLPAHGPLVLVGSSMGGYVATLASQTLQPAGLFLMAPAFYLPGYAQQDPAPHASCVLLVHGWGDTVVPAAHSLRFAQQHRCALHLLDGDHRLDAALPQLEALFALFLKQVLATDTAASVPAAAAAPARPTRAWVRQPSGSHLDLVNPEPEDFDDSDLALGLARTFRWGGHSVWPRPLTVAQHSLTVLALRRQAGALSTRVQLLELLHDAEEGLVGFDPISPLKPILGAAFQTVMERLQGTVLARYQVGGWQGGEHQAHKQADVLAAASEAVHVAGWSREEVQGVLGITLQPLEEDPLVAVYGGTPWEPWPVDVAARRFLAALQALKPAHRK